VESHPDGLAYDAALVEGRALLPGIRIGRPGRSRMYWPTVTGMRALRLRWDVDVVGAGQVQPGPAILVANHVSGMDPVAVVLGTWWRVTAFTKVEFFEGPGAVFFRFMGQIPMRRGDEASTSWALGMAAHALAAGSKIGLYPEGTRSPDPTKLHRLHKRVLIPVLQGSPDVPVHAITTSYERRPHRRTRVTVRVSARLPLDARVMGADEMTELIKDALLSLGGQTYVDEYARDVKQRQQK
jgi:1-acyl-sn-glycerol-3-phosphate acyltransferase